MPAVNHRIRVAVLAFGLAALAAHAQAPISNAPNRSIAGGTAVEYMFPEQVTVPAGRPSPVSLHFRIRQGLHINSHTPRDGFLIPTTLSAPGNSIVRLEGATYPDGEDLTLPLDPKNALSVYTGEFTIQAHIVASRGNHLLEAKLRFQACNDNACMPPKTIPVAIDVIGK